MEDTPEKATQGFDVQAELRKLEEDKHLNLFYCYGASDKEGHPLEDNLTRAFIQTLRLLSGPVRRFLLQGLFRKSARLRGYDYGSNDVEFSLQGYMDASVRQSPRLGLADRHIVTITTLSQQLRNKRNTTGGTTPDAWISLPGKFCILVESKVRSNTAERRQIEGHLDWLFDTAKHDERKAAGQALLDVETGRNSFTWYNVLEAIEKTQREVGIHGQALAGVTNQQQDIVLRELKDYIGFYGYHLFDAFSFDTLRSPPEWQLCGVTRRRAEEAHK